jgi:hypothetical protein
VASSADDAGVRSSADARRLFAAAAMLVAGAVALLALDAGGRLDALSEAVLAVVLAGRWL